MRNDVKNESLENVKGIDVYSGGSSYASSASPMVEAAQAAATSVVYNVNYTLESSELSSCNIPNELFIDNTGDEYLYKPDSTKINNTLARLTLNTPGSLLTLNALSTTEVLSFQLTDDGKPHPAGFIPHEGCVNIQYGFMLSEVMRSLGNFQEIPLNEERSKSSQGNLSIHQRAYIVDKDGCKKIIFNFHFKNNGEELSRDILFKDLLPDGVVLTLGGIFVNGCYAYPEYVTIEGRVLYVRMPDIKKKESATLTLICDLLDEHHHKDVNIGVVAYVSQYYKEAAAAASASEPAQAVGVSGSGTTTYVLNIVQNISNAKRIDESEKSRGFCIWQDR